MDSSSEEDVKKKGWLVVTAKGSIETSSDEEIVPNQASAEVTGPDILAATRDEVVPLSNYLQVEPDSPTLLLCGSFSSEGSTLVSGLPSPLPSNHNTLPLDSVEENLSSVINVLKANVEREDSHSVDSFEVLSEGPDGGDSVDSQNEDLLDEEAEDQQEQFISDSDSDVVKLAEPSEMESVHSGIEDISQAPQSQSPDMSSSLDPTPATPSRPKNAPYEDVQSCPPEEESDHVRIMSRRWPTEDGGFLLVQRFRKVEQDAASTVSSNMSDSSFSMVGNRQRLLSDTQEEREESDAESQASDSSFGSEETLPVNVTVRNVPPAIKQYLHRRNDVFNSKLTFFAVFVLTAGLTLGIGHFVGSSQMVTHYQNVQEGQKLRLRSLQDELVSCMDKRKQVLKLLQDQREVNQCLKVVEETPKSSLPSIKEEESGSKLNHDEGIYDRRLCGHCQKGQLRYSKFCNTICSTDSEGGHTWVATDIFIDPSVDATVVDDFSHEERIVTLQSEKQRLPIIATAEKAVNKDEGYVGQSDTTKDEEDIFLWLAYYALPGYLRQSGAGEDLDAPAELDHPEQIHQPVDTEKEQNTIDYSTSPEQTHSPIDSEGGHDSDEDVIAADEEPEQGDGVFEGRDFQGAQHEYSTNERVYDDSADLVGQVSNDDCSSYVSTDLQYSSERHNLPSKELGSSEEQTSMTTLQVHDTGAKWICIDGSSSDETCMEWSPKEVSLSHCLDPVGAENLNINHDMDDSKESRNRPTEVGDRGGICDDGCSSQKLESEDITSQVLLEKIKVEDEDVEDGHAVQSNEDEVVDVSSLQETFQSALGIIENASMNFLSRNISLLNNATKIMIDHAQDLKRVVETSWQSIQSAAVQVNEHHIQPMVSKVTQLVDKHVFAKRGRWGNKCRGGRCQKTRKQKQIVKKAVRRKRTLKNEKRKVKNSHKKQNLKASKKNTEQISLKKELKRNIKPDISNTQEKAKLKLVDRPIVNRDSKVHLSKLSQYQKSDKDKLTTVKEANSDEDGVMLSSPTNQATDIHAKEVYEKAKLPPKLNIEKLLDSLDMSCGGEVKCVENHKMDAARLLKEMISYRQWLWEQRFRKDVDEVEDFMEELEEFIDEEDIDDEDIEDLKDEFEDMVEDIQKTAKKFFKKQKNQSKGVNLASKSQIQNQDQKLKETLEGPRKTKEKRTDGAVAEEENVVMTGGKEFIHRVTFSVEDLPNVQLANTSLFDLSDFVDGANDGEVTGEGKVKLSPSKVKMSSLTKQTVVEYTNTDQWFFRRAHDRQMRRASDQDSEWYFKRFRLWEQDRKMREQKDWYFQRGRSRETSRSCATQPLQCDWAKDESVVTVWEMYKWLTERFSIRAGLRTWDLEDQINWFLRKP